MLSRKISEFIHRILFKIQNIINNISINLNVKFLGYATNPKPRFSKFRLQLIIILSKDHKSLSKFVHKNFKLCTYF